MKFGKVEDKTLLENFDFELPKEPNPSIEYLSSLPKTSELKIYVGSPAWGIKDWRGKIYPEKAKPDDFLKYYAESFNSIELNTTHYRMPEIQDIFNWVKDVPADFKFCPKVTNTISHYSGLTNEQKVTEFFTRIEAFGENLGLPFMQVHENFSPKRFNDLVKFIGFLKGNTNIAIELRHPDWFKDDGIFKYLRSKNISSVISDTAGRRDVLHMNITSPKVIIRFVGNNLHPSDYLRIDKWVQKIKQWSNYGIQELYFFVHEPEELACPEISEYFIHQLSKIGLNTEAKMNFLSKEAIGLDL